MKNMNCEDILIQKMALLDGEKADLSAAEIDSHLAACENCRRESEALEKTAAFFRQQTRRMPDADLWPAIEKRIGGETTSLVKWQPLVLLGAFLVVYKLVEMLPEQNLGWALKLVPFVLIVVVFGFLKENPFKINTELILENKYE